MKHRLALKALVVLVFLYGATAFLARGMVGSMLYQPHYGSRLEPAGAIRIPTENGQELSAFYLPNPQARLTVWYFHGNAEALSDIEPRLRELHALGYAVFAYDYPGYGKSSGEPSERAIYAANDAARAHLTKTLGVSLDRVVLYGRSLGGGPAVDIASQHAVAGLVLESTFTSVFRVMTRWPLLPGDQFKNARKLPKVKCPVLIFHGKNDWVIPFHHGETLLRIANEPKTHLWLDYAGHNDIAKVGGDVYWKTLTTFLNGL